MSESYRDFDLATNTEFADREGIAPPYMPRVMRQTLLAPDVVEVMLDGRQGSEVTLARLLALFAMDWRQQQDRLG